MFGFLKKLVGKEEEQAPTKVHYVFEAEDEGLSENEHIRIQLNNNLPVTVMSKDGETLCEGCIIKNMGFSMVIGRLPGTLRLATLDEGMPVTVMAYNVDSEAMRLNARVRQSSALNLSLTQLEQVDRTTRRGAHRLPVNRPAQLFVIDNGKESEETSCTIIDISMTGACIQTDYKLVVGDIVRVRFELMDKDGVNSSRAEVTWVTSRDGVVFNCGLLFEEMEGWKKKYLRDSIDELQKRLEHGIITTKS